MRKSWSNFFSFFVFVETLKTTYCNQTVRLRRSRLLLCRAWHRRRFALFRNTAIALVRVQIFSRRMFFFSKYFLPFVVFFRLQVDGMCTNILLRRRANEEIKSNKKGARVCVCVCTSNGSQAEMHYYFLLHFIWWKPQNALRTKQEIREFMSFYEESQPKSWPTFCSHFVLFADFLFCLTVNCRCVFACLFARETFIYVHAIQLSSSSCCVA